MPTTNYRQLALITAPENLAAAWQRVSTKKAAGGWDGQSVAAFAVRAETELALLQEELLAGKYEPQPLLQIAIPKTKNPAEKRMLALPAVRDKVAQEAVRRVLDPLLNRHFLNNSYGYRPGKGPQRAIRRVCHILQMQRPAWVASLDIDEFFPSIDHQVLLRQLRTFGIEEPVCHYLLLWLKMGQVKASGRWLDVYHGISQGGIVSPLLANVYLHPLDMHLHSSGIEFVRYADDIRLFAATRRQAEASLDKAQEFLRSHLKLKINELEQSVAAIQAGFTFLGLRLIDGSLHIDPAKWETIIQKLGFLAQRLAADQSPATIQQLNESLMGWQRYYGTLVDNTEIVALRRKLQAALAQSLADKPAVLADLPEACQHLQIPGDANAADRQQFWQEVKAAAHQSAEENSANQHLENRVRTTIRRAKRRHIRKFTQVAKLVINTPGVFLGKRGNRVIVRHEGQTLYEALLDSLESITLLSQSNSLSSDLITCCASREIPICWISPQGRVEAFIYNPAALSASMCQSQQLAAAQNLQQTFDLASSFVVGKIKNQISLVKYFGKYEKKRNGDFLKPYVRFLEVAASLVGETSKLAPGDDWPHLRGHLMSIEGRLAAQYWDMIRVLLTGAAPFPGRVRQGAKDLVNSLLNYGYAVLYSQVLQSLLQVGLNPHIGFLHAPRPGAATLVFDLMEIFRPQAVDRVVFSELRRHPQGYSQDEEGRLTLETRKRLVSRIQARLSTIEKFRGKELKLEEIILSQAKDLRRHIAGSNSFRPYLPKW